MSSGNKSGPNFKASPKPSPKKNVSAQPDRNRAHPSSSGVTFLWKSIFLLSISVIQFYCSTHSPKGHIRIALFISFNQSQMLRQNRLSALKNYFSFYLTHLFLWGEIWAKQIQSLKPKRITNLWSLSRSEVLYWFLFGWMLNQTPV